MKQSNNLKKSESGTNNAEISCGNCWGHQEYLEGYVDKAIDLSREQNDNFISRFVRKYIRK